ncbi:MAG TPA: transcription antitermination factor NusB [Acidobacteriota bacterium]|nr:transcription antitermination factor NusB [Acidobacteriota bacterium]
MSRRRGRELAVQLLFQHDQSPLDAEVARRLFWSTRRASPEACEFADSLYEAYLSRSEEVDAAIRNALSRWRLERLSAIDRSILRAAIAESWARQTPKAIVIDEAVEMAKKYGGEKSHEFVNAVLDRILKDSPVSENVEKT